jgi:glycosyltransferase involved in cell wall biosynthesis
MGTGLFPTVVTAGLATYVVCGLLYWILQLIFMIRTIRSVRILEELPVGNEQRWPRISVIVPARNEEKTILQAVRSRLRSDYPNLEILLVNDRSTDGTGAIIEKIAAEDDRVRALHVKWLPPGWLGKIYAMHHGAAQATGEWLLFSDADVYIRPGTLKRVLAYAGKRRLDHVPVLPDLYRATVLVNVCLSIFIRTICAMGRVWEIEDPKAESQVGAGAFNLVRKRAFDRAGGFSTMKMSVADDVALGRVLKRSGARGSLLNGRQYVGVHFYHSVRDMAIGSERAIFTLIGGFSLMRLILMTIAMLGLELAPFISILPLGVPILQYVGLATFLIAAGVSMVMDRWAHRPLYTIFLHPVGIMIMAWCMLRAGILGRIRNGIIWRGTFYPTRMLRQGTITGVKD